VGIEQVEVPLSRLPAELDGFSIVQLSDVHVGLTLGRRFVERLVESVNALEPDAVAITGDLVDGPVERLGPAVAPLANLRTRHGTFFVTCNHEYYSGAPAWCDYLTHLGLRVLRNERVSIGSGAASLDLAGIDDESAHRFHLDHGADLERAVAGRDPSRELVLLAHQPRAVGRAEAAGVGLQISGHTHGGQIWPFHWLVPLQQPVVAGLRRVGNVQLYVSRGTGYWGPPMRLGSPPEITRIVLRAARASAG
jgi:predicted MPP superfamily phosphohydrolase